jgi:hypothetical protein
MLFALMFKKNKNLIKYLWEIIFLEIQNTHVFSPYGDCLLVPFTLNNFVYNEVLINMNEE